MVMGRPRSPFKKTEAIQIRLSPEERVVFDRVLEARREELDGIEISPPAFVRWLILKEARERGFDKPSASKPASSKPAQPPGPPAPAAPSKKSKR